MTVKDDQFVFQDVSLRSVSSSMSSVTMFSGTDLYDSMSTIGNRSSGKSILDNLNESMVKERFSSTKTTRKSDKSPMLPGRPTSSIDSKYESHIFEGSSDANKQKSGLESRSSHLPTASRINHPISQKTRRRSDSQINHRSCGILENKQDNGSMTSSLAEQIRLFTRTGVARNKPTSVTKNPTKTSSAKTTRRSIMNASKHSRDSTPKVPERKNRSPKSKLRKSPEQWWVLDSDHTSETRTTDASSTCSSWEEDDNETTNSSPQVVRRKKPKKKKKKNNNKKKTSPQKRKSQTERKPSLTKTKEEENSCASSYHPITSATTTYKGHPRQPAQVPGMPIAKPPPIPRFKGGSQPTPRFKGSKRYYSRQSLIRYNHPQEKKVAAPTNRAIRRSRKHPPVTRSSTRSVNSARSVISDSLAIIMETDSESEEGTEHEYRSTFTL